MKGLLLASVVLAFLCGVCHSLNDDAENNRGGNSRQGTTLTSRQKQTNSEPSVVDETRNDEASWQVPDDNVDSPHTHMGHTGEHDKSVDQEALVGGQDAIKRLNEMNPDEAREEIRRLVKNIDTDKDGVLSKEELIKWLKKTEEKANHDDLRKAFLKEDINKDGFVTFEEFLTNSGMTEAELREDLRELEQKRFSLADLDSDGQLNQEEFEAFANPSHHDHMMDHLIQEQLNMYDKDGDGYIGFDEYMAIYNPSHKPEDELPAWIENEKEEFRRVLDVNKDGKLDSEEIKKWLTSDEDEFYREEADHLMESADQNKDGTLSEEEVIKELDIFLDSPFTNFGHLTHEEL